MPPLLKKLAPHAKFLGAVLDAVLGLAEGGRIVVEVKRRKADGIQAWDIVSTDALKKAREAEAKVNDLYAQLPEGDGGND